MYRKTLDLSINPNIGTLRSEIYLNLLSFPVKKHVIYYVKKQKGIVVIRVLHSVMQPKIHNFLIPKSN
ncbi:MAG: type II toxin-antitoxin system RelE/ParE family toxin [Rickettsia endosymbiont of Pentastiridius leporinus]